MILRINGLLCIRISLLAQPHAGNIILFLGDAGGMSTAELEH
jgi:hypothetical protein